MKNINTFILKIIKERWRSVLSLSLVFIALLQVNVFLFYKNVKSYN